MKRTALIICLAAIMLLALAVPAFANPDGTSGTVYGKAVLAPYAIVVSGGGTDPGSPLTYQGNLGHWAMEMYGSNTTVQNVGTQDAAITIGVNELPTAGTDVWNLATCPDSNQAVWEFENDTKGRGLFVLPQSDPNYAFNTVADPDLAAGSSDSLQSVFVFPTSVGSSEDHYMSATISAVPAIN